MMKRTAALLLCFCLMLGLAQADGVKFQEYTDVPGMPTQDSACLIQVLPGYQAAAQPADEHSMEIFQKLFPFVYEEKNRPVRFYDGDTQSKIASMVGNVDPDKLHMTEYMTVQMTPETEEAPVVDAYKFDMLINVDYVPGQLVVAVIGTDYQDADKMVWHPYLCTVTETGRIVMDIPEEDLERFKNEPVLLNMLTDRVSTREIIWTPEKILERIVRPSKSLDDLYEVIEMTSTVGRPVEDTFRLFTVDMPQKMEQEVQNMRTFLEGNTAVVRYFPENVQHTLRLLFPNQTDLDRLIAYEIIAVKDRNYRDTNGDVAARLSFPVQYQEGQLVAAVLGLPKEDDPTVWEWTCMQASVKGGGIETVFEERSLIRMTDEPALLMILSEPIPETSAE